MNENHADSSITRVLVSVARGGIMTSRIAAIMSIVAPVPMSPDVSSVGGGHLPSPISEYIPIEPSTNDIPLNTIIRNARIVANPAQPSR